MMILQLIKERLPIIKELKVLQTVQALTLIDAFMTDVGATELIVVKTDSRLISCDYTSESQEITRIPYTPLEEVHEYSQEYRIKVSSNPKLMELNRELSKMAEFFDFENFWDATLSNNLSDNTKYLLGKDFFIYQEILIKEEQKTLMTQITPSLSATLATPLASPSVHKV